MPTKQDELLKQAQQNIQADQDKSFPNILGLFNSPPPPADPEEAKRQAIYAAIRAKNAGNFGR